MPTTKTKNFLYALALPLFSVPIPAQPVLRTEGRSLVNPKELAGIIRRYRITGGAIALQGEGGKACVFTKAVHTGKEPGQDTYYRVSSITKMAAALVCTILMDQGILDHKKPVNEMLPESCRHLPELSGITLGHLLSHTSGLTDPPDLEGLLLRRVPLEIALAGRRTAEPGKAFCYSNLGFGLVGSILESVFSLPVEQVFRRFLFSPLALDATLEGASVDEQSVMPVKRILSFRPSDAVTVTKLGRIPLNTADPEYHYGYTAGSMYITLPSLVRLTECIRDRGKPLVSGRYSEYMVAESARYGKISPSLSYGHGLLRILEPKISGSLVCGHQGFAYGCVDGAFWEESTGSILVSLNGGCSEERTGRLGRANFSLCRFAFRKEIPQWK